MSKQDKNIESIYPLSPMQQGMLFHTLLAPKSGVYFQQILYTLTGSLQEAAFQLAWQQVVDRHELLRTLFVWEGQEKPLQVVRRRVALPWEQLDWRGLSDDEQTVKLAAFLQTDRQRGFDLVQAPLMRLALIRMDETRHELIWSHHHLLMDGWSSFLILKDVMAIYQALKEGRDCRLGPLRPYRDYINWLQKYEQSKAESYWRAALKGFTVPTPLLGSKAEAGHAGGDYVAAQQVFHFSSSLMDAMKLFAKRHALTLSTLVHAAWAMMLSRYSGEHDIVFGSTGSGRSAELEGIDSMVGLFLNTLPVRAQFSPQDSVLAWLRDFQSQLAELRQYEHSPLVDVQGWSEVDREYPLFESIMVFENYPVDTSAWGQDGTLQISNMRALGPTNYPLTAIFVPGKDLYVRVSYDSRRFDAAAISRMLGHLNALLEGILSNPDQRLSDLSMLSEGERHQLLVEWNDTQQDFPRNKCIHEVFEEQVERTPEDIAVVFEEEELSYAELNRHANQQAHYLRELGVGPDDRVAICVERGLEMVVALLAVLKAGGAYVPLDPAYPAERLRFMLKDSAPVALLTQSHLRERFSGSAGELPVLDLDTATPPWRDQSEANPDPGSLGLNPNHLAYVIYTSGSTGQPKGVVVTHGGLVNHMLWMMAEYPVGEEDVVLCRTAISFDAAVWEIWLPLLTGATLCVAPAWVMRAPSELVAYADEHRVTIAQFVPSLLASVFETTARSTRHSFKRVFVGGEAFPSALAQEVASAWDVSLINLYGPTETTIEVTSWMWKDGDRYDRTIPIGRPIWNTRVYVLDSSLEPVPIGVAGELHIGGAGVARGYLNRPELTAEKFIPDPFSGLAGARLYKTGDLCRWRSDGNIEFVGRIDHQVKLRGFRIELGEIEARLVEHPAVREAVVLAREDTAGEKRLVAYYTASRIGESEEDIVSAEPLRAHLAAVLPEYMVPAAYVRLASFPLTPNGKLDRKALPAPERSDGGATGENIQPINLLELELTRIWQRLFQRDDIGRQDNFFALGGHSLLATRLTAEIDKLLSCKLPIAALFQSPTIESLARRLNDGDWVPPWSSLVPLQPNGSKPPLFFVHGFGGDVYGFLDLAGQLGPDQPSFGIQAVGLDGKSARHITVEDMAAHYVREIVSFQKDGPLYLAGYSLGGVLAFEIAQQLHRLGRRVALLALLDSWPVGAIPWLFYGLAMATYIPGRCLSHFRRLWKLPLRERLTYVQGRWQAIRFWMVERNRSKPTLVTAPLPLGSEPPLYLGSTDYYLAVAFPYHLRSYPGSVDLFVSDVANFGRQCYWRHLARGGAAFHRVPGGHLEILSGENLPVLAKSLTAVLQRKQANERAAFPSAGKAGANLKRLGGNDAMSAKSSSKATIGCT